LFNLVGLLLLISEREGEEQRDNYRAWTQKAERDIQLTKQINTESGNELLLNAV